MASCTYTYKGKKYSKDYILRKLAKESLQIKDQDQSITWLKEKLGMTDSEIIIVKGLIENKSLGRFLSDGKILLSHFADTNTAYHEAFHRVFRLYTLESERYDLRNTFRKRKNWRHLLANYEINYPNLTEDELIEEYFADEFSEYVNNPSGFVTEQPIRSLFDRIIDFISSLFNIKKKDITRLYKEINSGVYASRPKVPFKEQYRKKADKILIEGYEMSVTEKSEVVNEITRQVINKIIGTSAKALEDFIAGKNLINDFVLIKKILQDSVIPTLKRTNPDLATAIEKDYINGYNNGYSNSIIYKLYKQNISRIGVNVVNIENEDIEDYVPEMGIEMDSPNTKGEFTSSIEVDPKSNLSKRVKLLLASFVEPQGTTSLGFQRPIQWSQAFLKISETMAGVPTEEFMDVLKSSNLSFKDQLIRFIDRNDPASLAFRNDFISNMARTINNFVIAEYRDGDLIFFNANVNTKTDKIVREWQSGLVKIINELSVNVWKSRVSDLLMNKNISVEDIENILGFKIDNDIDYGIYIYRIADVISKSKWSNTNSPDWTNLFKSLDIQGTVKQLAMKQSEFEDSTDMMIYAMNKRIYGIGLNTHVTTVVNRLAYAQKLFEDDMSDIEKLDIIRKYAPYIVSPFNVTYNEDNTVTIHNAWLRQILDGKTLKVNIVYNIQNDSGEEQKISDLDETDLFALHVNSSLSGITMSMKHSDRSIYYGYSFDGYTSSLINPIPDIGFNTVNGALDYLTEFIADQIRLEVSLANRFKDNYIPFQYFGKLYDKPGIGSILGEERFNQLVKGDKINERDLKEIKQKFVKNYYKTFVDNLEKWKVIDRSTNKHIGISSSLLANYNNDIDLVISTSFVNEIVGHISENRLFNNDLRFYKNPVDFFKRLSPTSSTGQILVNDDVINEKIRVQTDLLRDIQIYNPLTGKTEIIDRYNLAPDGYMRGVTLKENELYRSSLLDPAITSEGTEIISKLTGKQESKLFMIYEWNELQDNPNITDQQKEILLSKIRSYENKYNNINENDGQSYMNIIAFRNYMNRLGQWTEGMENVFNIEMQIMSAKSINDIANIEIEIKGKKVKVFEVPNGNSFYERLSKRSITKEDKVIDIPIFEQFHPFHTLKTQYSGFSMSEQYLKESKEQIFDTSIFKTSMHILLPSNIIGTNLALMNLSMIKTGTDVYHMGSANKVGGIDPALSAKHYSTREEFKDRKHIGKIAEQGLEFYNEEGQFNHDAIVENTDIMSYLFDVNFMKDQVKIGNKVKDKIKGSTQSLKIILSNLIVNGAERFDGAQDILNEYKQVVKRIVELNIDDLNKELDSDGKEFKSKDNLKKVLLQSQLGKGAPENVLNSIENFIDDPIFEKMSNKNKIENILYSIITNTAITFNRPGNSYPQAAVTGYEKVGQRKVDGKMSALSNDEVLKFYTPHFDEQGNITKIDPAEIIIPLPDYWIEPILKQYKTRNLVIAINKLNSDITSGKVSNEVTLKGLRIPNQQLSSNDIFKVKRFGLPTMQSYIIVPTEIVTKVGSDMDIDKVNIYWQPFTYGDILSEPTTQDLEKYDRYVQAVESINEEPLSFDTWYGLQGKKQFKAINTDFLLNRSQKEKDKWIQDQTNKQILFSRLLDIEKKILLHPRNAHHLLMPLTDDILASPKTGVYKKIWVDLQGNPVNDSPDLINSLMPYTQVKNGIIFVKGKFGVGIVALGITGHSTSQADSVVLNTFYNSGEEQMDTMLRFEGHEKDYGLNNYTDNLGNIITEILSQLLTTQVDNVKNPVSIKLGINNQTLNVVEYLIRRGVNPTTIIAFIKQPLINEYLEQQRINESISNKTNGEEINKIKLINEIISKYYKPNQVPEDYLPNTAFITQQDLFNNITNPVFDTKQIYYLNYFHELLEQSKQLSNFSQEQTADTKSIIDKTAYEVIQNLKLLSENSMIIPLDKQNEVRYAGVLSPFTKARELYRTKFDGMYISNYPDIKVKFDKYKEMITNIQKTTAKKERAGKTFENDFVLFFAMKYVLPKIEGYYDDLFGLSSGKDSLATRVLEMKNQFPDNILLKAFLPLIKSRKDQVTGRYLDNLRIFERELTNVDTNDLLDAMKEIAEIDFNLYRDISVFTLMQSGFNNSPFNYLKIIPVGNDNKRGIVEEYEFVINDVMKDTILAIHNSIQRGNIEQDLQQFFDEFQRNNPQFLRARTWKGYPFNYFIGFKEGNMQLFKFDPNNRKSKIPAVILGTTYNKRYGLNESVFEEQNPVSDENITRNQIAQREYTPENITSLKSNEVFVFGSNTEGRHGKGAALIAKQKFGAKYGQAKGLQGQSYGIITKDLSKGEKSISLTDIGKGIEEFINFAKQNPNLKFYVTKLGSSLAGYKVQEIRDLWSLEAVFTGIPDNIILPKEYEVRIEILSNKEDTFEGMSDIRFSFPEVQDAASMAKQCKGTGSKIIK